MIRITFIKIEDKIFLIIIIFIIIIILEIKMTEGILITEMKLDNIENKMVGL